MMLIENACERDVDHMRFLAAVHGVSLRDCDAGNGHHAPEKSELLFRDPKDYESLSKDEKKALTRKMMAGFSDIVMPGGG